MAWFLYQVALAVLLLASAPFLLLRRGRHYLSTFPSRLRPRLEESPGTARPPLWLHAVSVGEVGVAAALARSLDTESPLLVSSITPTGLQEACRLFGDRARIEPLPFDFAFSLKPFFDRLRPRALVIIEGDLWPLTLHYARRRSLPIVVVNGRMSNRNFARLKRLRPLLGPLLGPVDFFAVQSAQDRDRLLALGVPESDVEITGNLKFDSPEPARSKELESRIAELAAGRMVLVAGSTMSGEESLVLDALEAVGSDRALLVLAPRHPERWEGVAQEIQRRGLAFCRRSIEEDSGNRPAVLLLDSLGELAGVYAVGNGAFVGGTLVPTGGHNPLEPARFGTPIVVGPSMENFPEIESLFEEGAAWRRVSDAKQLADCWRDWIDDADAAAALGRAGQQIVDRNRGALGRTTEVLERWTRGASV